MGIDFSHGDAHWSYSGFHRFRERLAAEISVDLNQMHGFDPLFNKERPFANLPWDEINDAIVPLLNHSDSDGELSPDECRSIAPRLRELVASWPDDYDKTNALKLAKGMDEAALQGVPLRFR